MIFKAVVMQSSSYYDAVKRHYHRDDSHLVNKIRQIREEHEDYGYRTVTAELKNQGILVNHKTTLRIMQKYGLLCHAFDRITRKYNSYAGTVGKVADNLINRRFYTDRPYQKVVTDVTELRWGKATTEQRCYFTAFIDLFSNEILEWNISLHPTVAFVTDPLNKLIHNRPNLKYRMTIHSDQGVQYQNYEYWSLLKQNKIFQSMSRKATCLDNASAESFFHILKVGTVHNHNYATFEQLSNAVSMFIDYYNNDRIRTKLAGKTPVQYRNNSSQLAS